MGTAMKHPVPHRVKLPVTCNFWHPGTLTLSPARQSARMSNITNDGLTRSGTGCLVAVPMWQQRASKLKIIDNSLFKKSIGEMLFSGDRLADDMLWSAYPADCMTSVGLVVIKGPLFINGHRYWNALGRCGVLPATNEVASDTTHRCSH